MKHFKLFSLSSVLVASAFIYAPSSKAAPVSSLVKSGNFSGALKRIGSSRKYSSRILRAELFDKMGLYHMALVERSGALTRKYNTSQMRKAASTSLVLGSYAPMVALAKRYPRSTVIELKVALAGYELMRGRLRSALNRLPSIRAVHSIKDEAVRFEATKIASSIYYGLNQLPQAASVLSAGFAKSRVFDVGAIKVMRSQVFYDQGFFEKAIFQMGSMSRQSASWYEGSLVSAWSAYVAGDFNLALGLTFNLHSPYLVSKFGPESYMLEAATLYQLCYYRSAQRSVQKLQKLYGSTQASLRLFNSRVLGGEQIFGYIKKFTSGENKSDLNINQKDWSFIVDALAGEPRIGLASRSLNQLRKEIKFASKSDVAILRSRASSMRTPFSREYYSQIYAVSKRKINNMRKNLSDAWEGALSVDLEVNTRLRDRLVRGQAARKKDVNFEKEIQRGYVFWPFEGEFWRDETGSYAFATTNVCEGK